jgi:predicted RND superfamily exporter protein
MLVVMCVLLVDLFLVGLIHYWGLTFNTLIVINIIIAIGLSVDYSAHIAHTYLTIDPPPRCRTARQKRAYKASVALS